MSSPRTAPIDVRAAVGLGVTAVAALLLWHTWIVWPLKVLVVFLHEISHGLAAVATGGAIERIELSADEGGICWTRGGSRFWTLSAGYLGSVLFGGLILVGAARSRVDRWLSVALGVLLLAVCALYVRPLGGFGFAFAAVAGLVLVAVGAFLSHAINDALLRVIGLTSCLYAVADIKSDVLERPGLPSDAALLAEHTGLPTLFWGALWIAIAALGALLFLAKSVRRSARASGPAATSVPRARR